MKNILPFLFPLLIACFSLNAQELKESTKSKWTQEDLCSISGCFSGLGEEFLSGFAYHVYSEKFTYDQINSDFERCDKETINAKKLCSSWQSRRQTTRSDLKEMFKEANVAQKAASFRSEVHQSLFKLINDKANK